MGSFPNHDNFPTIPPDILQSLDSVPSTEEIHSALMEMAPLKSPDDLILYAKADMRQATVIQQPLDDTWIPLLGPLRSQLLPGADASQVRHVSDLLDSHGCWDVFKLSGLFSPAAAIPHILSICCPNVSNISNKPVWGLNDSYNFDIKSTYSSQANVGWDSESNSWQKIWSLCLHPNCPACRSALETVMHVLRDCHFARTVWMELLPSWLRGSFFHGATQDWLLSNVGKQVMHPVWNVSWDLIFISTVWQIWKARNEWIFHSTQSDVVQVLHHSVTWARYYSKCEFYEPYVQPTATPTHRWQRLEQGWICLNTDGAVSSSMRIGSIGGLLIQSDNKEAIRRINDANAISDSCSLVRGIAKLRRLEWVTDAQWISRDGNKIADALAKLDNLPNYVISTFAFLPESLLPLLEFDRSNIM
ncbi:hypothetical protein V6N11_060297 [Hibiscus sabdariffa]|uniref:RNase H type-1 domain-containing protein n=1 Tax=Hibiscus sabdariffa TaxID=183260 RepID=A0ABR2QPW8_9ROSI